MRMTSRSRSGRTTGAAAGAMTACRNPRPSRGSASPSTPEYDFPPLTEADLPRIRQWLLEPHVSRWWADPPRETYPDDAVDKHRRPIRGADDHPPPIFFRPHRGRPVGSI